MRDAFRMEGGEIARGWIHSQLSVVSISQQMTTDNGRRATGDGSSLAALASALLIHPLLIRLELLGVFGGRRGAAVAGEAAGVVAGDVATGARGAIGAEAEAAQIVFGMTAAVVVAVGK